ncbi:hypothetical protein [Francisella philomiragia]|uniref:Uncharacterized protein n=1 Tax=Francisella philomiragia TaxID=28110 RepID=A0A0B6CS30_9GAMM|nr:hypothetical protein [Francisella philomiragia]AJI53284.1 hypothetical protein LA55_1231 [Francisella philomiragia]
MIDIDTSALEKTVKKLEEKSFVKIQKAYDKAMRFFISVARITLTREQQRELTSDAFRKRLLIGDSSLWFGQNMLGVEKFTNATQSGKDIVFGNNQRVKNAWFMKPKQNKTALAFTRSKDGRTYRRAIAPAKNTILDKNQSKNIQKHLASLLQIHFYPKFKEFLEAEYAK